MRQTIEVSTKYKVDSKYFSVYTFFVGCFIFINRSNINQNNKKRKLQNIFSFEDHSLELVAILLNMHVDFKVSSSFRSVNVEFMKYINLHFCSLKCKISYIPHNRYIEYTRILGRLFNYS